MPVSYQLRGVILRRLKSGQLVLPDIDGREETKADVVRALLSGAHPYLISEEGTGKTRLARSLTKLLPQIPVIKGCPYNDDPKWPSSRLCPRCQASKNPVKDFGVEIIPGMRRFSRIQGNEYTNEAKLLGLKDIQAIAHGMSPSDPRVFTGTGVFRANRGILFVDELPAIRTKVQVLFHPILEERKAILEEYNWEHPLDLVVIATGNPNGFSHVNDIPRPLLDRLEPVYMDLPEEETEKEIMLKERFRVRLDDEVGAEDFEAPSNFEEIKRRVIAPWWIIDVINKAVRYSRICPYVERKPSIRATHRAIDHTYASVEIENKSVASLRHVYYGLRLALRGRMGLRADLIDFDNPRKTFKFADSLAGDFMWNALEDMRNQVPLGDYDDGKLNSELETLFREAGDLMTSWRLPADILSQYPQLAEAIELMKRMAESKLKKELLSEAEIEMYENGGADVIEELNYSALEMLVNLGIHERLVRPPEGSGFFLPHKLKV